MKIPLLLQRSHHGLWATCWLAQLLLVVQSYELIYFDFAGRAEVTRIVLWAAQIPFQDTRLPFAEYSKAKQEGQYAAGLPVFKVDNGNAGEQDEYTFTQSLSIARYAGKLAQASDDDVVAHLYPLDALQALRVDQALDIVQDVATRTPQDKNEQVKKTLREEYFGAGGRGFALLQQLEQLIDRTSTAGPFVNGRHLSIADLHLHFLLVQGIESGNWDYVPTTYLHDHFPTIAATGQAVSAHPLVMRYYDSLVATKKSNEL